MRVLLKNCLLYLVKVDYIYPERAYRLSGRAASRPTSSGVWVPGQARTLPVLAAENRKGLQMALSKTTKSAGGLPEVRSFDSQLHNLAMKIPQQFTWGKSRPVFRQLIALIVADSRKANPRVGQKAVTERATGLLLALEKERGWDCPDMDDTVEGKFLAWMAALGVAEAFKVPA